MAFKSINDFISESKVQVINEAKEKFKISTAKVTNKNGEAAFVVKFVGTEYDNEMMKLYLEKDPATAPAFQKVKENPDQYFFIYRTINAGDARFLAPNTKKWATYLELINAKDKDGKSIYVNFNKPPYNNFVKWTDAEKLINTQDPSVVGTGKQIVASIDQTGTQQAQAAASTDSQTPEQSVEANAQQFLKTGKIPGQETPAAPTQQVAQPLSDLASRMLDSLVGISMGSSGKRVNVLQNAIEDLAKYTKNTKAESLSQQNIRPGTNVFDQIYGTKTATALQLLLNLPAMPKTLDAGTVNKLKDAIAKVPEIKADSLGQVRQQQGTTTVVKHPNAAPHKTGVAGTPAPAQQAVASAPTRQTKHSIMTNIGKIKY